MTLLISTIAACISTIIWYVKVPQSRTYKIGLLCLMYWGASIMWLGDAIMEYLEVGVKYFTPAPKDMLNDSFLGISVVILGLIIWLVFLLAKDPKGVIRGMINE